MADFTHYFPTLLANEGGYCHDLQDPGGETYKGIARVSNPKWPGWPAVDVVKAHACLPAPVPRTGWRALSKDLEAEAPLNALVMSFYKASYWNPLSLDAVRSQCVAEQLADHGVNAGTSRPAKMLQYLLATEFGVKLVVDGQVGPRTIAALNAVDPQAFYTRFVAMRRAFYTYRTGSFSPTDAPALAPWHRFFQEELRLKTDSQMQKYLTSWISRTQEAYTA
jgi:lysozyme family protein